MAKIWNINRLLEMASEKKTLKEMAKEFNCSIPAVWKKLKRLEVHPVPESFERLTDKQKKFVVGVLEGETATQSALKSFEVGSMDSAKSLGCRLMKDPDVKMAISDLMAAEGLTRRYRIKRLKECIDHRDPNVRIKALDQSWKLDGSYAPEKSITVGMSYADIIRERRRLEERKTELLGEYPELKELDPGNLEEVSALTYISKITTQP